MPFDDATAPAQPRAGEALGTNAAAVLPRFEIRPELGGLTSVLFMMVDELNSVVLHVTAAAAKAGTSTVAREIATAAAASGWCKVALLGAHAPRFPTAGRPGLVELFERGEEPVLHHERIGGAPVATARLSAGGNDMVRVESVRGLYGFLRQQFTVVVVDCPPVLSGQHAAVRASAADGTLRVLEAEQTRTNEAARARERLEQLGATMLGVVLNKNRGRVPGLIERLL